MAKKKAKNVYDDGNIPSVDLPKNSTKDCSKDCRNSCNADYNAEPLPESTRPRKDGPGGA